MVGIWNLKDGPKHRGQDRREVKKTVTFGQEKGQLRTPRLGGGSQILYHKVPHKQYKGNSYLPSAVRNKTIREPRKSRNPRVGQNF